MSGPRGAGRQAAALFALGGLLALVSVSSPGAQVRPMVIIGVADLVVAAAAWWLPWDRWGRYSTLVLAFPALAIMGYSTYAIESLALGTGAFFVLSFAWLGLHHPPWCVLAVAPVATVAYVVPLALSGQPSEVVGSAVVLVPVMTVVGMIIARDVEQLHEANAEVRRAEQWRSSLMLTLAHDVRSPLTSVQGVLDLLKTNTLDADERLRFTEAALRQTARITRLASGLLDAERVERGRLRLDLADVPLREAVTSAVDYVGAGSIAVDIGRDVRVEADPERLEQIVINLTSNALRHGDPPIVIAAGVEGSAVRLTVRDHGPGIPEADRPRLFEQFSAADRSRESVGLGLWIVRQLVEAHGGEVAYEPADPGARFVVTLQAGTPSATDAWPRPRQPA
jgi:signal transduction histidine kinase